ncbi:MAG: hypothetical protein WCL14_08380 [Bacteroidota bacterium]
MKKYRKAILIILLVLNSMVLMGQLWPEGVPPFARSINIIFLSVSLLYFMYLMRIPKD